MRAVVAAATLVAGFILINSAPAFSQDRWGFLTPAQSRAYHACLFEAWIQDYCHWNSFAYGQCVVANGGGRYPLNGRLFTEDYCWETAQGLSPR
jgi:hypothetical protein